MARQSKADDLTTGEADPRDSQVEVTDLANIAGPDSAGTIDPEALLLLQAMRIVNALTPGKVSLALPVLLGGEPTDVQLRIQVLTEQYYHKDYALRIRIENETQGKVEFQLRTRGPGLYVDLLAENVATLAAYHSEADAFSAEMQNGAGFLLRKFELSVQTL